MWWFSFLDTPTLRLYHTCSMIAAIVRGSALLSGGGTMKITISQAEGRAPVTVFHLHGELTADTAPAFEAQARAAIDSGTRNLLLDLTDVPFIGSFGIRSINNVLVALYEANGLHDADARRVLRTGKKALYLKLLNPNPQVMNVLESSGFDMLLEVHHDEQQAVEAFP